jgi:methyl-accepting chemotaxis protein
MIGTYFQGAPASSRDWDRELTTLLDQRLTQRGVPYAARIYLAKGPEKIITGEFGSMAGPRVSDSDKGNIEDSPEKSDPQTVERIIQALSSGAQSAFLDFRPGKISPRPGLYAGLSIRDPEGSGIPAAIIVELAPEFMESILKESAKLDAHHLITVWNNDESFRVSYDPGGIGGVGASQQRPKGMEYGPVKQAAPPSHEYRNKGDYIEVKDTIKFDSINGLPQDFGWTIITSKNRALALDGVRLFGFKIFSLALLLGLIAGCLSAARARTIANPIRDLSESIARVSKGDLSGDPPQVIRQDELGELMKSYCLMVKTLKKLARRLREFADALAQSSTEIAQTTSEMSASYSTISATVTQTSTAMDQVREAAMTSMEQAKDVARNSAKAVEVTQEGRAATESVIEKMMDFKTRITVITEKARAFRDSSGEIEVIVSTVQDLADQSNLLSVNAAIEAMRAGEHGKGFSVVAHEIKAMADQSRQATDNIKQILENASKSVTEVVTTTQEGESIVDEGVMESAQAGHVIETLISAVERGAESASVIVDSTDFQFEGVDQVTNSMKSVTESMGQGAAASKELEREIHRLKEMGLELKRLMERYRL